MDFTPLKPTAEMLQKQTRPHSIPPGCLAATAEKNRAALVGLSIILFISLLAVFGPMLSPYSYSTNANQPPSASHWFGTDNLGRDLATRVCYGARISLAIWHRGQPDQSGDRRAVWRHFRIFWRTDRQRHDAVVDILYGFRYCCMSSC